MSKEEILKLIRIKKEINGRIILRDVSLSVAASQVFCLLAKNASGKTTLVKIIAGAVKKDGGEVFINGKNPRYPEVFDILSVLYENPAFYPHLSLKENLEYFKRILGQYSYLPIKELELTNHLDKKVKQLSRGTIQKTGLVLALWKEAKVYILDEPLAHLDPGAREFIKNRIASLGNSAVFITTHMREALDICTKIAILENGEIKKTGSLNDQFVEEFFRERSD